MDKELEELRLREEELSSNLDAIKIRIRALENAELMKAVNMEYSGKCYMALPYGGRRLYKRYGEVVDDAGYGGLVVGVTELDVNENFESIMIKSGMERVEDYNLNDDSYNWELVGLDIFMAEYLGALKILGEKNI